MELKGLAKLGNIVANANASQFSRAVKKQGRSNKNMSGVKNIFASRTQILRPKHMFLSLATPGNITRNIRAIYTGENKTRLM